MKGILRILAGSRDPLNCQCYQNDVQYHGGFKVTNWILVDLESRQFYRRAPSQLSLMN
jgi:hypothetical protein